MKAVARGDPLEKPFLEETLRDGKGPLGGQEGRAARRRPSWNSSSERLSRRPWRRAMGSGGLPVKAERKRGRAQPPWPGGPPTTPPAPEEGLRLLLGEGEVRGLQVDEPPLGEELGELGVGEGLRLARTRRQGRVRRRGRGPPPR
ncbi:hypothetical protein TthHB5018_b24000 (plasmid) [Thermus thermophilus]|uniref:Uncharacterized protein n=1 Tax=Thermus thermophilus TaxID=274 RepID=A0A7R7TGZ5_THETH|nr:hypothetical protein TthHB5018_b24000 [Thermus thermophilus]